jgi:hypothetical protein
MAYPCWCHSCSKFCRGRNAEGFCLDTDMDDVRRRCAAIQRKCGLEPVQKTGPVSAAQRSPDTDSVITIPAAVPVKTYAHRFDPDFSQWRVLLDGIEQTDVWSACLTRFPAHLHPGGFVQYGTGPTRFGTVEIRAAAPPSPSPPPAALPAAPQLTMEL